MNIFSVFKCFFSRYCCCDHKYKLILYYPADHSSTSSSSRSSTSSFSISSTLSLSSLSRQGVGNNNFSEWVLYVTTRKQLRLWKEALETEIAYNQQHGAKSGPLLKKGGTLMVKWQTRWCHLIGGKLEYFEQEKDTYPKGTINVIGGTIRRTQDPKKANYSIFEIEGKLYIYLYLSISIYIHVFTSISISMYLHLYL